MASSEKCKKDRLTPTQARAARRTRRHRRRRVKRIAAFSAVGVVAFLLIASLFAGNLPISIGGPREGGDAGTRIPDAGTDHISRGEAPIQAYTSVPATSGSHYSGSGAPARWAVYDEFVQNEVLVHNLEHAGIGIHYDCPDGCDDLVAKLTEIAERYHSRSNARARKVIMSPFPDLDSTIALTAWNYLDTFDEFDEERIITFIEDHMNSSNAPEPLAN